MPKPTQKNAPRNDGKCPITFALDLFGDKWSLLIVRDLLFKQKKYYGEFLQSPEKISTNILADRLSKLESAGLLSKQRDPDNSCKFIYRLTPKGRDLIPLMLEIIDWSSKHDPQPNAPSSIITGAPANLLRRLHKDRNAVVAEILSRLD